MATADPSLKRRTIVDTIPSGDGQYVSVTIGSGVFTAGRCFVVRITNVPDDPNLSLWNFEWSLNVDVDDVDHDIYGGASVAEALQKAITVTDQISYQRSSDRLNARVHQFKFTNNDAANHTIYFYYKAYTQVSGGTTA